MLNPSNKQNEHVLHTAIVYKSPDGKHCSLVQMDDFGTPDTNTGVSGVRYVLPKGISCKAETDGYMVLRNDDDPNQEVFIDNDKNGVPAVHLVYKDCGETYQDIIPIEKYENTRKTLTERLDCAQKNANAQNRPTQRNIKASHKLNR